MEFSLKKFLLIACLLSVFGQTYAADETGIIEKVRVCGTGETGSSWRRTLQFRVNGKWFGIYADYYSSTATDYDNNIATSLVLSAFSQSRPIRIKATKSWAEVLKKCGVSTGHVFHSNAGDFIEIDG